MLSPLAGRAKGLVGRSAAWLICEGRRTKGLFLTGDSESGLVGDRLGEALVGDVGGVARAVAGD